MPGGDDDEDDFVPGESRRMEPALRAEDFEPGAS